MEILTETSVTVKLNQEDTRKLHAILGGAIDWEGSHPRIGSWAKDFWEELDNHFDHPGITNPYYTDGEPSIFKFDEDSNA